jgi:hypothetical protein
MGRGLLLLVLIALVVTAGYGLVNSLGRSNSVAPIRRWFNDRTASSPSGRGRPAWA